MSSKFKIVTEAVRHKGFLQRIPAIIRMYRSVFSKGGYQPHYKNIVIPGLVAVYLISPLDIIPDWIPVIGAMDDIALLAFAIPLLLKEAELFLEWESSQKTIRTIDAEEVKK